RQSIFIPEHEIENDHVRMCTGRSFECLTLVTRLGHDLHALIVFDQHAQTTPDHYVIVNYHDGNRSRRGHVSSKVLQRYSYAYDSVVLLVDKYLRFAPKRSRALGDRMRPE